jgi:hypothetical protein
MRVAAVATTDWPYALQQQLTPKWRFAFHLLE